jgi:hypothetical protein
MAGDGRLDWELNGATNMNRNYIPNPTEVARVQANMGLDLIQARNHVISRELAMRAIAEKQRLDYERCLDAWAQRAPRFAQTSCSQCGAGFGPGDSGYSSCADHAEVSA